MNEQTTLHGFRITRVRELSEIGATMYEMVYEKNGAQLVYLDRADTNKTFAIAFKTIPDDDTGVFHIIEHSVLCGSRKYPSKDPFVELLKGSMQTFLNAFTFPDKTMYPVCSRNDQDFLNLVDVYMDAVLHPQILTMPEIFYQEGWHYEWTSRDEAPSYKGVVFNEMKGAYSSVDGLVEEKMGALLYPDNCYGRDSGGDPVHIPELTYEKFLACHGKYYHPSNARIILDGEMDLDAVLGKLDSFLCEYEYLAVDADIPMQAPIGHVQATCEYELAEGESTVGKDRLVLGFMGLPFDAQREGLALSLVTSVLCGSNEAPLKQALLSRGLCQDVNIIYQDGIQQSSVQIDVQNIADGKEAQIEAIILDELTKAAEGGLSASRMTAALNSLEFRLRERDFGRFPRGLVYAMSTLESWLYGGDPAQNLCYDEALRFLREHLSDGYIEGLLRRLFLESEHRVTLLMKPSKTLAQRRLDEERARLDAAIAAFSEQEAEEVFALNRRLLAWQQTPDSPEAIAKLPALSLSDISDTPERKPIQTQTREGVTVLYHDVPTAGIVYTNLYFNIADTTAEELPYVSLLCHLFTRTATEARDALAVQDRIKTHLGYLSMSVAPTALGTDATRAKLLLHVACGVLESNKDRVTDILDEVFYHSKLDNKEQIRNILRQIKMDQEAYMLSAGHQVGVGRTMATLTVAGAVTELVRGYSFYTWVKDMEANFDERADALIERLSGLLCRYLTRRRVTLSLTGAYDEAFMDEVLHMLPLRDEQVPAYVDIPLFERRDEGICIASQISYAVRAAKLPTYTGAMAVAEGLLSYEYLWNQIRVQGGAYGAGQGVRRSGYTFLYSYRDPDASRSLGVFDTVPSYLRSFAEGGEPIDKFIIGAIGSSEPLMSPRAIGDAAATEYLCESNYEEACRIRREMLATTPQQLSQIADLLEVGFADGVTCVVGGKEKVEACGDRLDTIFDV